MRRSKSRHAYSGLSKALRVTRKMETLDSTECLICGASGISLDMESICHCEYSASMMITVATSTHRRDRGWECCVGDWLCKQVTTSPPKLFDNIASDHDEKPTWHSCHKKTKLLFEVQTRRHQRLRG